jgi:hypothetical protein
MLRAFPETTDIRNSLAQARWIDLVDPTPAETAAFKKAFDLRVPTKEELSENRDDQSAPGKPWCVVVVYDGTAYYRHWRRTMDSGSAVGHVWTAPPWQELSDAAAALVGWVSGLFVRR